MKPLDGPVIAHTETLLAVENVSLGFGGVKALSDVSFDIRKGEIRAIIGPERRRQDVDAELHQRFLSPDTWQHHFQGRKAPPHETVCRRERRHRPNVPERRIIQGHVDARQHHDRPQPEDA